MRRWLGIAPETNEYKYLGMWMSAVGCVKTKNEKISMREAPMYEKWYDGSLGGDLLFRARAQCMDVNAKDYRWSESRSKVCQVCDVGEDETVEHEVLKCVKYARDRYEMIQVVLRELGHDRVEMTGREWMVVLLGLCEEMNERMIEAVKEFLERMWRARCRN
ncbi:hypothetical protein E2C01_061988 [Portunus trituberculatus]|uniref:Reverse transcriptase zinc-binding domain-containing protein n=1 Tax=Portunus trituberculatus TaxID=210409 RepID=A0A5B7H9S1_PORTR|nr:hypothetical protein [Portunus trituberculatus]